MLLRLDRLLTLYFFGPLARLRKPRGMRIPILMYHSISDDPETGHPYYWINTSPALFAQHMQYLADLDYKVIPLSTAVEMIRGLSFNTQHSTLNTKEARFAVLTFDDGYADFYSDAFPVLKKHGFTATVFLTTDYIDNKRPGLRGKEHLTWDQVHALHAAGITFGSHTCTHPQLYDASSEEIELELRKSKETIKAHLTTVRVDSFCYPYKFPEQDVQFVSSFRGILESAGYGFCTSTRIGTVNTAADIFRMKRIPVNSGDDTALFAAKLRGGYDWVQALQAVAKRVRRSASHSARPQSSLVTHQRIN